MKTKTFIKMINGERRTVNGFISVLRLPFTVLLIALAFTGCKKDDDTPQVQPSLTVASDAIEAGSAGSSHTIAVTSNVEWTTAVNYAADAADADWCTVTPDKGNGNGTVTVQAAINPVIKERAATVTITSTSGALVRHVAVTQTAGAPFLTTDPANTLEAETAGSYSQTIAVTSNSTWTVASNAAWCTVDTEEGDSDGQVTVTVAENPTVDERAATVTFTYGNGQTHEVAVTQVAAAPFLTTINIFSVGSAAGDHSITVTSNSTWTAAVNTEAGWCTLTGTTNGEGNGTVGVHVDERTTPGIRTAIVTFIYNEGASTHQMNVAQTGPDAILNIDPETDIELDHNGGTRSIAVTSNTTWAVNPTGLWCNVSTEGGSGSGNVTVTVDPHTGSSDRTATVQFSCEGISKEVTVRQQGFNPTLTLSKTSIPDISAAGDRDQSIGVTSNTSWNASVTYAPGAVATDWCTVSPTSGSQNRTVSVDIKANPTTAQRAATITFTGSGLTKEVSVTQDGAAPTLTTKPSSISTTSAAGSETITVESNTAWTVASNATDWCTVDPTSGDGNGAVTVTITESSATASRTATITFTYNGQTKTVAVTQTAAGATPVSTPPNAASTNTWTYGTQTWSDAIQITACEKSDFTYSSSASDCRSDAGRYYYNWTYVSTNATTLCPTPWRVPAKEDFDALRTEVGANEGATLTSDWGYGGYVGATNKMMNTTSEGYYWSTGAQGSMSGYQLKYSSTITSATASKSYGEQVRCVK
jgi:uncharacterized protein (TIGR02145 family)